MFLFAFDASLPLVTPVLKFLVILLIILSAPLILNKIKIPHILGLIIAGAIVGPFGFHILERDSGIILSGTAGLLYIMFLAGLEVDLLEFKKNSLRSFLFGMYTFLIPMSLGTVAGYYILQFSLPSSILLASLFASHTLITYPIIAKFGIVKNKAVTIAVGGTIITDTLALLVLAVIVGMSTGEVNEEFWTRLSVSILVFALIIIILFPIIARWFFKRVYDSVSQYIFVLVMVFSGAVLAEIAGIEAIIGAFLAGLALNRLIPSTSPLMNRIEFVGNAVFIPFFLIGVGMLVDYRAFISDIQTIIVAGVMIVVATTAKFIAAWLTQKSFAYTVDQRRVIFGLSNAQAAATLAAVMVGYSVILGETETGQPIRLLNESVLNGAVLMILITCTIASFVTQKGARNISLQESSDDDGKKDNQEENILLAVHNPATIEELVGLTAILSSKKKKRAWGITVIDNKVAGTDAEKKARKLLDKTAFSAAAADINLEQLLRYDISVTNGIASVIKEHAITDLVLGLQDDFAKRESFLGTVINGILATTNVSTFIYRAKQPINTIKRHIVVIPKHAELEVGFPFWVFKVWNIAQNTGAKIVFYGTAKTLEFLQTIQKKHPIDASFEIFDEWKDFLILSRDISLDDNVILILSREDKKSYHSNMLEIPRYLDSYFHDNSFLIIYPIQFVVGDGSHAAYNNPSLLEPIEKLDEMSKTISRLFKKR